MELIITRSQCPVIMEGWQHEQLQNCQHQGVNAEDLLLCTSGDCVATDSKIACQQCITKKHFHNDMLQFQMLSSVEDAIRPLKIMSERRLELEQQILCIYQRKLEKMRKMLELHRDMLLNKLELIVDASSCQKVTKIKNGNYDDPKFLLDLCQGKLASNRDKQKLFELEVQLIKAEMQRWERSETIEQQLVETIKRGRQHSVQQMPNYKKRQFETPNKEIEPTAPSITVLPSINLKNTTPNQDKSSLTTENYPVPNNFKDAYTQSSAVVEIDDDVSLTKSCRNFGEAIGCIHRYKTTSQIEIMVDEDRDAKEKGRYSSKYVYELSKLTEVQNLCLKFGFETMVSDWMLRKIDEIVSGLPKIKKFELSCWVTTPELTKAQFQGIIKKIGKEFTKVQINLRKTESQKVRNTKTENSRQ